MLHPPGTPVCMQAEKALEWGLRGPGGLLGWIEILVLLPSLPGAVEALSGLAKLPLGSASALRRVGMMWEALVGDPVEVENFFGKLEGRESGLD